MVATETAPLVVGALAMLNLGTRESLRAGHSAAGIAKNEAAPPLRGSALVVVVTDAPLDDRQCRHVAALSLHGLARLGVAPAAREGLVACVISTGVQLTRNDRRANEIELPHSSEMDLSSVAGAAADAVEEAGLRTLTTVKTEHGTAHYPVLPVARAHQMIRNRR